MKKVKSKFKKMYYKSAAAVTMGLMMTSTASFAQVAAGGTVNTFSTASGNLVTSMSSIPGLVSSSSYLIGLMLAALGIMKVKDHVENPTSTPLKEGAIRLAAGGAMLALPFITSTMIGSVGAGSNSVAAQGQLGGVGSGLTTTTTP